MHKNSVLYYFVIIIFRNIRKNSLNIFVCYDKNIGKGELYMNYIQLKKVFHVNEAESNELYLKRFNGEATKRLGIVLKHGYECFYLINSEILYLIDRIYAINTCFRAYWMNRYNLQIMFLCL